MSCFHLNNLHKCTWLNKQLHYMTYSTLHQSKHLLLLMNQIKYFYSIIVWFWFNVCQFLLHHSWTSAYLNHDCIISTVYWALKRKTLIAENKSHINAHLETEKRCRKTSSGLMTAKWNFWTLVKRSMLGRNPTLVISESSEAWWWQHLIVGMLCMHRTGKLAGTRICFCFLSV